MKKTKPSFSIAAALCIVNLAFASQAANTEQAGNGNHTVNANLASVNSKETGSVSLDAITITATKTPIKVDEVPVSVDVLTGEDIEHKANANNGFDALRSVGGVQVKGTGTGLDAATVTLRGERPGILLNGQDMKHFSDNYSLNPNFIDMGLVERIEVLKGPQSTMHGGRSVSGAVNFIMKKGDKDAPFLSLKSGLGSGKTALGGITTGGGIERFSYIFSYYGEKKDKFKTPNGVILHNYQKRQNFYTRLDLGVADDHEISFDYTYNKAQHASGGEAQMHEKLPLRSKSLYGTDKPNILKSANLSYEGKINRNFTLFATTGAGEHNFNYIYGTPDYGHTIEQSYLEKENFTTRTNKFLIGEIRGIYAADDDNFKLVTGIAAKRTKLEWKITENHGKAPGFIETIKETESFYAPYAQVEYRPVKQILAIAGVRYDKFSYDKANDKSATSPRFSLSYMPFAGTNYDYTTLWGSYTASFNPPGAHHLVGYSGFVDPNPNINPERALGIEFGVKQRISEWAKVELSYFNTDYKDKISLGRSKTPNGMQFLNIKKAQIKGYEVGLEIYPLEWLALYVNFTDFSKKDKDKNERLDEGTANEILQYGVSVDDFYGFYANIAATRFSDYKNASARQKFLGKNYPSEGKTIVDTRISYRYEFSNGLNVEPYLAVNNLTNQKYYEGFSPALAESRNYLGGVNFNVKF